jgi:hypothetical protein
MADKYACASGLASDTATWSLTDAVVPGAAVPVDGDVVYIGITGEPGVSVQMDVDQSAFTGLLGVTIRGHATTPSMLYQKAANGPQLRIGTTKTNVRTDRFAYLIGSTYYSSPAIAAGTALAGSDVPDGKYGAWALDIGTDATIHCTEATGNGTGYDSAILSLAGLPAVAASHVRFGTVTASNSGAVFDPGTTELDAANVTEAYADIAGATCNYGHLKIRTGYNLVGTTVTNRGRLCANSDGAWATTTALPFNDKFIIDMNGTSQLVATNLDINLRHYEPNNKYVATYGQVFAEATVSAAANTLTYTGIAAALPNGTLVRVSAGSGALPAELSADTDYWVVGATGNTIQLATSSGGSAIDLSAGGPINIHCGLYANWGISGNTLTKTTHGIANNVAVMVKSTGVLPTPLVADTLYYVVSTAAGAISLAMTSAGTALTLGGTPSGTLDVYTGSTGATPGLGGTNPYTSTIVNVLTDVSAATGWTTNTGHNKVVLCDAGPADYDQQRLTLSTITSKTMTLSAAVDSVQYPGSRTYLSSRNISIRSTGVTTGQPIIDYSTSTFVGSNIGCEIINTGGSGTTFYGYGVSAGTNHTVSGTISGCNIGVSAGTNHTISGPILGCYYGVYSGTNHTISGPISGCYSGVHYGTNHTISGPISGCYFGVYYGTNHTISGPISGCYFGVYSGINHTISGPISGCLYGVYSGTNHTISGLISGCAYHFVIGACINCVLLSNTTQKVLTLSGRNTSYSIGRIYAEDAGGVAGENKITDMYGDILNTSCDGTGDAPSEDPDGEHGYCIEVSNVQSNVATATLLIFEYKDMRVWATADVSKTYTFKCQTTFSELSTAGRLILTASYLSSAGTVVRSEITDSSGIAVRSNAADWTQNVSVIVEPKVTGWISFKLELKHYEANDELYVWPSPYIT